MAGSESEDREPVAGCGIVLHPEAVGEMEGACDFYEAKSPGFGADFLNAVDACDYMGRKAFTMAEERLEIRELLRQPGATEDPPENR